jgi:hypothetical protein
MLHGVALAVPWTAGVATLDADLSLLQPIGAVDGPYDGAVLGMVFSDSDGAALLGLDVDGSGSVDHLNLGSTDFRAGRLSVGNAHGSELRDLDIPLVMQFYAGPGQGFVTHSPDDCSPIAAVVSSDADTADPAGIATFGIYNRETELIHQREIR